MEKLKQNGYVRSVNQPNGILIGNWYPKHRPLQIYRKQGNTTDNTGNLADTYWIFNGINIHVVFGTFWYEGYGYIVLQSNPTSFVIGLTTYTFVSNDSREVVWRTSDNIFVSWMSSANNEIPCEPKPVYVKQYKLLGKKTPDHKSPLCCPETGVISSFSGRAQIRPARTIFSPTYFSDTSQYLRSRGESYLVNSVLSKLPGVEYINGTTVIWPNVPQVVEGEILNSSIYQSCATVGKCTRTIYKPSNSKFATQGAVTSAERLLRLKTESKVVRTTITGKKLI